MKYSQQQKKIIRSQEDRVLVHAVAGSGKTTVIKAIIKQAINTGTRADKILACTFTRKMAGDLRDANPRLKWCDTIHGVCLRIVEKNLDLIGYEYLILIDDVEHKDLVRKCTKRCAVNITQRRAHEIVDTYCSTGLISQRKKAEEIFLKTYLREIREGQMITYGLMELYALQILGQRPDIGFDLVVVDEYQDTSSAEVAIIDMLAKKRLIMVGDAMQGIYSFRGATPENIYKCHPDVTYEMTRSYRLDNSIADVANKLIALNGFGYKPRIESDNEMGSVTMIDDISMEAIRISMESLLEKHEPQDIFVLTRTNREIAHLLEIFEGLPVDKDMSAVKNMKYLSYLDVATRAYYNNYYNYGMLRLLRLFDYRDSQLIELENSGKRIYDIVKNDIPIREFDAIMRRDVSFVKKAKTMLPMFEKQRGEYDMFMVKVLPYIENIDDDLAFMTWYGEISSADFMPKDKVAIITAHMSKGMEADAVMLPYIKDGAFPHAKGDPQEELRLLYVACTRAKHQLVVHHNDSTTINTVLAG
jgi:superfamily I DNA/RNA helicase